MPEFSARASELIAYERRRDPRVVELARLLSIAAQIEPSLVRAMRLELMPSADAGIEADLWFSTLVQVRDPDGFVLLPDVVELLRHELTTAVGAADRAAARRLVEALHADHSPLLRLEETVLYLSTVPDASALMEMERELGRAYLALEASSDEGVARWIARRLPGMPAAARASEPALALARTASRRLNGARIRGVVDAGGATSEPRTALLSALPRVDVGIQLTSAGLEISQPPRSRESTAVAVPQTSPLILDVAFPTTSGWQWERVTLPPGGSAIVAVPVGVKLTIRTVVGDFHRVRPDIDSISPVAAVDIRSSEAVASEFRDLGWSVTSLADKSTGLDAAVIAGDAVTLFAETAPFPKGLLPFVDAGVPLLIVSADQVVRAEVAPDAGSRLRLQPAAAASDTASLSAQLRRAIIALDIERAERWIANQREQMPERTAEMPLGATLVDGGAAFHIWAPDAHAVHVVTDPAWKPNAANLLERLPNGRWRLIVPGVQDGDPYLFWIRPSRGDDGFMRDPYARELASAPVGAPHCIVRDPRSFRWHDHDWTPPPWDDLVIYELHVGVFTATGVDGADERSRRSGTFLDVVHRIEHLNDLGVNAVRLLPIHAFSGRRSAGYNPTDFFAQPLPYQMHQPRDVAVHLSEVNRLLGTFDQPGLDAPAVTPGVNQLKALVDLLHLHGIAVLCDVVYTHAWPDASGLSFFARADPDDLGGGVYFSGLGTWGPPFDYARAEVRQFLIDNALAYLKEYHLDGLVYPGASEILERAGGEAFCRQLMAIVHDARPQALHVAEAWGRDRDRVTGDRRSDRVGFDVVIDDRLLPALRRVIAAASAGASAYVDMDPLRDALLDVARAGSGAWRRLTCLENHDVVFQSQSSRVPRVADPGNAASWYARSRSRVAIGILLTAPGTPMLFMGQEWLEDRSWSDDGDRQPELLIDWESIRGSTGRDFYRFLRDAIALRRREPALRGDRIDVFHVNNLSRVFAYRRSHPPVETDAVIVVSLYETEFQEYKLGFPRGGLWRVALNSNGFDETPNAAVTVPDEIVANGPPMHGLEHSASIQLPPNSLLVFVPIQEARPVDFEHSDASEFNASGFNDRPL